MAIMDGVMVEAYRLVERQNPTSSTGPPAMTSSPPPQSGGGGGGPTNSPLLFFVALGFGVVFTNLWIIVGVKYCFRYNARNRAIRNGEEVEGTALGDMASNNTRRRRREKKLMTMDEVNERFPLTKYKNWVANRASEGLPTAGGVTAPPSRAGSVRNVDGATPASPVDTKHSINTRPTTAVSDVAATPPTNTDAYNEQKKIDETEKGKVTSKIEESPKLEEVETTATMDRRVTTTSVEDDDDDDDHIHTAVPPELLTNPGDSCAICIDTLEDDDDIRGLTCGHAFHAGCLDPWLTSRRACCPLCKADYYTPKPRPEGETGETERGGRRREGRTNTPQQPPSAWIGVRGSRNQFVIFPTRFGNGPVYGSEGRRFGRRGRGQAAAEAAGQQQGDAQQPNTSQTPEVNGNPTQSRWRNPLSGIRLPGRIRTGNGQQNTSTTEPSPSQLEAGTTTVR